MPAIILLIVFIGLAGGIQIDNNQSNSSGDFPVSAEITNPDTYTGFIPGGVVSNLNSNQNTSDASASVTDTPDTITPITDIEITVKSASNIDFRRATLRGEIKTPNDSDLGTLFFAYSNSQSRLISNTLADDTYDEILADANIGTVFLARNVSRSVTYDRSVSSLQDDQRYYYRLCVEGTDNGLLCSSVSTFETVEDTNRNGFFNAPSVSTQRATDIQASTVTLKGSFSVNDAEDATVFFVYGESQNLISSVPNDYDEYSDVEEARENLQKVRVGVDVVGSAQPEREIDDLERSTTYYHRLCIGYDGDDGNEIRCGNTQSFMTDSRDRDEPEIRSISALVGGTSAALTATLSMEDYNDGHAFLVYGTDVNSIEQVSNRDRFSSVSQSGDRIQRVSIDADFDGRETVTRNVTDLLSEDEYYYRFCIEYEADNDFGFETSFLACSDVETFTTN